MPSVRELVHSKIEPSTKSVCESGLIRLNFDDNMLGSSNVDLLTYLRNDTADLEEFKLNLNEEELDAEDQKLHITSTAPDYNSLYLNPNYYDVQKLLINEKGEDKYHLLRKKKN
jgi:hypothetical protein